MFVQIKALGLNWPCNVGVERGVGGCLYTGERPQGHHGPLVYCMYFVNECDKKLKKITSNLCYATEI
jgi:hypothetical protein